MHCYCCFHWPDRKQVSKIFKLFQVNTVILFISCSSFEILFTSWCLWPVAKPMVGACWDTSPHHTSPVALCLGAVTWNVLLFPCLPPDSFPAPCFSCSFWCRQHPPTRKYIHCHHYQYFMKNISSFHDRKKITMHTQVGETAVSFADVPITFYNDTNILKKKYFQFYVENVPQGGTNVTASYIQYIINYLPLVQTALC